VSLDPEPAAVMRYFSRNSLRPLSKRVPGDDERKTGDKGAGVQGILLNYDDSYCTGTTGRSIKLAAPVTW
jgi:hypothetical protein